MRVTIYDRVEPPVPSELPLHLTQTCSQRAATAFLVLVVPAALGGTLAAIALVLQAMLAPAARAVIDQHPLLSLEVLAAIGFLIYLVALPTRRLIARLFNAICSQLLSCPVVHVEYGLGFRNRGTWPI